MLKPVEVRALPDYKLRLCYPDGAAGEIDLSEYAEKGVFKLWDNYSAFEKVYIGDQGQVA